MKETVLGRADEVRELPWSELARPGTIRVVVAYVLLLSAWLMLAVVVFATTGFRGSAQPGCRAAE